MIVENHIKLIDEYIHIYRGNTPKHLLEDIRQDILLRLLTFPKPDERYTDESWVKIISRGIISNFRKKESKYVRLAVPRELFNLPGANDIKLSVELNCNETEIEVAKMINKGHTYKDIAYSFGKNVTWIYRINKNIKDKLKE